MSRPALRPGDTIGIMAPSSYVDKEELERAKDFLAVSGYSVFIHPQSYERLNQSAGTAAQKSAALTELLESNDVNAIFFAIGGNRGNMLLPDLPDGLLKKHPKIIMGFSDATGYINAVYRQTGLVTFHGPSACSFAFNLAPSDARQSFLLLSGEKESRSIPMTSAQIIQEGRAQGVLIGGNLSLLSSLMGTPWEPDFENALLFIEDCSDQMNRYDRMIWHLRNAGAFDKIAGLIVGDMSAAPDSGRRPFGFSIEDILRDATEGYDFPIIMNAPFGHGSKLFTFPIGGKARLTAEADGCKLEITDPVVAV